MERRRNHEMNGISLFSGIGGLDLAFEWAGGNVLAMCEINTFCQKVLRKHWANVPIFNDIHKFSKNEGIFNNTTIDIIYGGFPCQPFSVAGEQKGKEDDRYLWPEFSRVVGEFKPRWVLAENVPGILSIAADDICRDLERQDYEVGIWDYEALSIGAPHRRERIFFVAHSRCSLLQRSVKQRTLQNEAEEGTSHISERPSSTCGLYGQWEPEPRVDRMVNGLSHRMDRLRALGNSVVPQQVYPLFKAIMESDKS